MPDSDATPTDSTRAPDAERVDGFHRFKRAMLWSSGISLFGYVMLLWNFSFSPFRPALFGGGFSNFYDDQARSLLKGNLYLEPGAAGIEAFVVNGREYLYFPPGPSILRMPLVALTDRFDSRLTAPSMLLAWCIATLFVALLMWRIRIIMRGRAPVSFGEAFGFGVLHTGICAGSVMLFLGSMPWVYHEAYTWSIAVVLGAMFALIGVLVLPNRHGVLWFGLFTLAAMMTRTTAGWACSASAVFVAILFWVQREDPAKRRCIVPLLGAGLVPLAVGIAVNWAKFQHPYLFPLDKQIFTGINTQRQRALEANGGDLVSFNIAPTTLINYFRPDGIRFTSIFPYITLPAKPAPTYGSGVIDQSYRTGSVVAFMPLLFGLAVWGIVTSFRRGADASARLFRIPLIGALLVAGPIMIYGYLAYRYTSEFMPLLILGSIIGFVDVSRRLVNRPSRDKKIAVGAMLALTVFGAYANAAVGFTTLRLANPGQPLRDYVILQEKLSNLTGHPLDNYIDVVDTLPDRSSSDRLVILGECEALFVGTGDTYEPWAPVELPELFVTIDPIDDLPVPGTRIPLATFGPDVALWIDFGTDRQYRAVVTHRAGSDIARWRVMEPGETLQFRVLVNLRENVYAIVPTNNRLPLGVPIAIYEDEFNRPKLMEPALDPEADAVAGVTTELQPVAPLSLCGRLLDRVEQ